MEFKIKEKKSDFVVKYWNKNEKINEKFFYENDEAVEFLNTKLNEYEFVKIIEESVLYSKYKNGVTVFQ